MQLNTELTDFSALARVKSDSSKHFVAMWLPVNVHSISFDSKISLPLFTVAAFKYYDNALSVGILPSDVPAADLLV